MSCTRTPTERTKVRLIDRVTSECVVLLQVAGRATHIVTRAKQAIGANRYGSESVPAVGFERRLLSQGLGLGVVVHGVGGQRDRLVDVLKVRAVIEDGRRGAARAVCLCLWLGAAPL